MNDVLVFRIVLREVSPLIWRRLQVRSDTTLAQFHGALLVLMDWSDQYLHRFSLHGRSYRVWRLHAPEGIDAHRVTLADLRMLPGEVLRYEYNLFVPWELDLRLETTVPARKGRTYPHLVSGGRAAPPEDLLGPGMYLEQRRWHEYHPPLEAMKQVVDMVEQYRVSQEVTDFDDVLRAAHKRIAAYVRYTSPKLDLGAVRRELAERFRAVGT